MYSIVEKIGLRWTVILGGGVLVLAILTLPKIIGFLLQLPVRLMMSVLSSMGR